MIRSLILRTQTNFEEAGPDVCRAGQLFPRHMGERASAVTQTVLNSVPTLFIALLRKIRWPSLRPVTQTRRRLPYSHTCPGGRSSYDGLAISRSGFRPCVLSLGIHAASFSGRAMPSGQGVPSGQLSENHFIAPSRRAVVTSASPSAMRDRIKPLLRTVVEIVDSDKRFATP